MDSGSDKESFGFLLSQLRRERDMSQLALALEADVSARHVSFLESGRSRASRGMVARLADALGAPPSMRNRMLLAAGYAPAINDAPGTEGPAGLLAKAVALVVDMQAATLDEAVAIARPALAELGLSWFHAGVVTRSPGEGEPIIRVYTHGHAHVAWLAHNVEYGYRTRDPLVRATLERHRPFFWDDVLGDRRGLDKRERGIFDEAKDFRVQSGFVMPIHRTDGSVLAMSCMGEDRELRNPATRVTARVICTALLEKFEDASVEGMVERPALQPAARDLLRWALEGRDVAWMARRLGASEEAVRASASEACASLGAADLLQGALRAQRYQLLEAA